MSKFHQVSFLVSFRAQCFKVTQKNEKKEENSYHLAGRESPKQFVDSLPVKISKFVQTSINVCAFFVTRVRTLRWCGQLSRRIFFSHFLDSVSTSNDHMTMRPPRAANVMEQFRRYYCSTTLSKSSWILELYKVQTAINAMVGTLLLSVKYLQVSYTMWLASFLI